MLRIFVFTAVVVSSLALMSSPASAFGGRRSHCGGHVYRAPVRSYYSAPSYYYAPRVSVGYGSYVGTPYYSNYRSGYGYNSLGRSSFGYGGYGYRGSGISIGIGRGVGFGYGGFGPGVRIGW